MNINLRSFNTDLDGRVLWYDGDTSVSPDDLIKMMTRGVNVKNLFTTHTTKEIEQYNKYVNKEDAIRVKDSINPLEFNWTFNEFFQTIDVEDCVLEALQSEIKGMSKERQMSRINRTMKELKLFKSNSLVMVLKLMIFIIDKFEQTGIVWGVGRGSSVSSYVLYLIGVHDVDSVEFDLPIEDFLHSNAS